MPTLRYRYSVLSLVVNASLFLFLAVGSAGAVEFASKSPQEIRGHSQELGVRFHARTLPRGIEEVTVVFGGKMVIVQLWDAENRRAIRITSSGDKGGEAAIPTLEDSDKLGQLLNALAKENVSAHPRGKMLLRTLNLLHSWPEGLPIAYAYENGGFVEVFEDSNGMSIPDDQSYAYPEVHRCQTQRWPPTPTISEDICGMMNQTHTGEYISLGIPVGTWLPPFYAVIMFYPWRCEWRSDTVGPFPFDLGECVGRCGPGCTTLPGNVYTQDCFNHDMCVRELGLVHPFCNHMFMQCVEDFLYGPDCDPLESGLVAHYPFYGNANDASGNGNHGTVFGATLTEDRWGIPNRAYSFDGENDYILLPNESNFDLTEFSIVAIVNISHYPPPGSMRSEIISKGQYYGNFSMNITESGWPYYVHDIATGNWSWYISPAPVPVNDFLHLAVTIDHGQFRGYLNGVARAGTDDAPDNILTDYPVTIGTENSFSTFLSGVIDDIRIYNRALSPGEIEALWLSSE